MCKRGLRWEIGRREERLMLGGWKEKGRVDVRRLEGERKG